MNIQTQLKGALSPSWLFRDQKNLSTPLAYGVAWEGLRAKTPLPRTTLKFKIQNSIKIWEKWWKRIKSQIPILDSIWEILGCIWTLQYQDSNTRAHNKLSTNLSMKNQMKIQAQHEGALAPSWMFRDQKNLSTPLVFGMAWEGLGAETPLSKTTL
jgi:hypothetical protein